MRQQDIDVTSEVRITAGVPLLYIDGQPVPGTAYITYFTENTPPENVTHFSAVYNQVVSLAVFVGPLLGTQIAGALPDLSVLLLIGAALRLAAGGLIALDPFGRQRPVPQPEPDPLSVSG